MNEKLTDEQIFAMFDQTLGFFDRLTAIVEQMAENMETVVKNLRMLNEIVEKERS